jgi:ATP-binding cassette subfamily B protein
MLATLQSLYVQAEAGLSRIAGLLAVDAEEPAGRPSLDPVAGEVRFEGVSFAYPGGPWVVRDVDLMVPAGGTLALVGKTGAGKTTLIRLLMGFLTPGRGRVRIDGHDLATISLRSLREHMAVVTQEPFLFRGTVADNLAWAAKDHAPDRVQAAAHAVGLINVLPRGLETEVSERGASLSAGERQLVALARALVAEPRLLILDEATSSVDPASEARVEEAIAVAAGHCTTVIVAHRLSTIRSADEIAVLDAGRVVERGAHDDLLRAGGAYARLYHAAEGSGIAS